MLKSAAAVVALMSLIAAPVRAQNGLFLGPHATGASLTNRDADDPLDFGSGFGAHAGLSFGGKFGLLAIYDRPILGAKTGDVDLGQWDLLGRMAFVEIGPARVYWTAGLSKRASTSSFTEDSRGHFLFRGMDPTAGLTGQIQVTRRLSVDAGLLRTFGSYSDNHGHSASRIDRLAIGVSYYLVGGRKAAPGEW